MVVVAELQPGLVVPMHYGTEAVDFVEGPEEFLSAVSGDVASGRERDRVR